MGIIVRNMSSNGFSNVKFGKNSIESNIIPFNFDSKFLEYGMSIEDVDELFLGEDLLTGGIEGNYNIVEHVGRKCIQFLSSQNYILFPATNDSQLLNRNFRIKVSQYSTGNAAWLHYQKGDDIVTSRLHFGNSNNTTRNLVIWNNMAEPRRESTHSSYRNKWSEIIWEYNNANSQWNVYIDNELVWNPVWSILPYTVNTNNVYARFDNGIYLESYKIQVEGMNWSGNFSESW